MSKVVVVRFVGDSEDGKLQKTAYDLLLTAGFRTLTGERQIRKAVKLLLPGGVLGMKVNCLAHRLNSTPVALIEALSELLVDSGFDDNNIVIWERTNRELAAAGYTLNSSSRGLRCLGTDTNGVGYSRDFYSSGDVNSLVTGILTDVVDHNINLPVLKDHSIAGMSAGLKNMYGAINNPNKFHDNNCDPYCAHISNLQPIRTKNRLTILDAARVQYNGGPGFVADYMSTYNGIIISTDPLAVDRVGLEILEHLRNRNGQPSLQDAGRPVKYLESAEKLGLGIADKNKLEIIALTVDKDGQEAVGRLF